MRYLFHSSALLACTIISGFVVRMCCGTFVECCGKSQQFRNLLFTVFLYVLVTGKSIVCYFKSSHLDELKGSGIRLNSGFPSFFVSKKTAQI